MNATTVNSMASVTNQDDGLLKYRGAGDPIP